MSPDKPQLPTIALSSQDAEQIMTALSSIGPGQRVIYHSGRLAADRRSTWKYDIYQRRNIACVAEFAYKLAMKERRVDLVQSKIGSGYDYVAIGRFSLQSQSLH